MTRKTNARRYTTAAAVAFGVMLMTAPAGAADTGPNYHTNVSGKETTATVKEIQAQRVEEGGSVLVYNLGTGAYSYDEDTHTAAITGKDGKILISGDISEGWPNSAIQARRDLNYGTGETSADTFPTINLTANDVELRSNCYVVGAQDGIINIGTADSRVKTVLVESTSTEGDSALYSRNAFGEGQINIYGETVSILTDLEASNSECRAIAGNYGGKITIDATDKLTIHGAIEGYNEGENKVGNGTSRMTFDITGGDNSEIIGDINAADKSKVNITLGANSAVTSDLFTEVANYPKDVKKYGGTIGLTAGDNSTFSGNITARTGGNISLILGAGSTVTAITEETVNDIARYQGITAFTNAKTDPTTSTGAEVLVSADIVTASNANVAAIRATADSIAKDQSYTEEQAPKLTITAKKINASGGQGGASTQDGIVTLSADTITLKSTHTLTSGTYTDLYAAVYARGYGAENETGVINITGKTINLESE